MKEDLSDKTINTISTQLTVEILTNMITNKSKY